MKQNLITLKIKYTCDSSILDVIRQYNSVLKFTYNRLLENPKLKTSEITQLQKNINNCDLIGSHLKNSAIYDAKAIIERSAEPIIFGGNYLFKQRCQQKIDRTDFLIKRLRPVYSVGESNQKANRLFDIKDNKTILFKLSKNQHFELKLQQVGSKRLKELNKLIELQNNKKVAITYKLDLEYVYLTFDYNKLKTYTYKVKENRVLAIDLNPNSIGWTVVDWFSGDKYKVIKGGTFSLKALNDYRNSKSVGSDSDFNKYITNKRNYEIIEIAKDIFSLCRYYHCEIFAIEELNIKVSDKKKGRSFNKLVNNQWNKNLLVNQLRKHINASSSTLVEVKPQYNSYIGNLVFREERLPDECLASIEIGRRGYEFATQYILNRRPHKKTVIYPEIGLVKSRITLSLEEIGIDVPNYDTWKEILSVVKESKVKYRFSTSEANKIHSEGLFSKFYKQKYLMIYKYL